MFIPPLALAGSPANKNNDGQNLLPIIEVKTDLNRAIVPSKSEHCRRARWSLSLPQIGGTAEALFDHFNDPRELDNIASRPGSAAIIERLSQAIPASPVPSMPAGEAEFPIAQQSQGREWSIFFSMVRAPAPRCITYFTTRASPRMIRQCPGKVQR